ncbi:FAD/NAD(P)-binding oxidoreductase [Tepiditoga spiralis]|uniref:FAD/NAD(P)-binding oxidoreductase n=1 Tax=Tepiditoga spiralis TaxID=2108365 RepID=A0A7G1G265_9BACT|nr:NAD(P)/FAD-dependent oxidoreductase [Tepiditoga spiralis]BBE30411.1 FAD/NAD(P)-binding oxidoreductase [Tepiditoga spiralis]
MKIVVIGGGVVGSLVARELCKYEVDVTLIDKNFDIGMGVSKANSAILHAGYDDEAGTQRAKFCVRGNELYTKLEEELEIDVKRIGSHVLAFKNEDLNTLDELYKRGIENGVPGMRILTKDEIQDMEPNINPSVIASLYAPTAGITEPWQVAIAAVENAQKNGLKLALNEEVIKIVTVDGKIKGVETDKNEYDADVVINAAGLYSDKIATMAGDVAIPLHPRRGEYVLLNKFTVHDLVNSIIFPPPSKMGKGILVLPTVDGGILLGPTSEDLPYVMKFDRSTTKPGIEKVVEGAKRLIPGIDLRETVKTFAGSRPESPNKDFWIGRSKKIKGLVHAAAMRSPGLTAAPAIAEFIPEEVQDFMEVKFEKKNDFDPKRKRIVHYFTDVSKEEYDEIIKKDPLAGKIVCVCNKVTEREVLEAIKRGATTLDGIKFRTRAMFGECQGGFCTNKLLEILSRETGKSIEELHYGTKKSYVVNGKVRP